MYSFFFNINIYTFYIEIMPIKLDGEKILVTNGDSNYELEKVKSKGYRELSQETTQAPTIVNKNDNEDVEYLMFKHDGSSNDQTTHTFTVNEDTICDIFMIGGGGGGGWNTAGGGGSGAAIISLNNTFNGTYTIKIGNGGAAGINGSATGSNGYDSTISKSSQILFNAKGGGGGGDSSSIGNQGGSAGGSGNANTTSQTPLDTNIVNGISNIAPTSPGTISVSGQDYIVLGTSGGEGAGGDAGGGYGYEDINGGGGGGLGQSGQNSTRTEIAANGGNGVYKVTINSVDYNLKEYFSPNTHFGVYNASDLSYYIGGGGGGGGYEIIAEESRGGLGGGGNGRDAGGGGVAGNGVNNTGSGGGGGEGNTHTPGAGGSGLIIIRKKLNNTNSFTSEDITQEILTYKYNPDTAVSGQSEYTINFTQETKCDILLVGGGGGGGGSNGGGGGGGGGLIFYPNVTLNGAHSIKVGKGGSKGASSQNGTNGNDSSITINGATIIAVGGGGGGQGSYRNGNDGGSGGGMRTNHTGTQSNSTQLNGELELWKGYGNKGGYNIGNNNISAGGGGAGEMGYSNYGYKDTTTTSPDTGVLKGRGGDGLNQVTINNVTYNFIELFGDKNGEKYNNQTYFAGGGAGSEANGGNFICTGGYGGGANSASGNNNGNDGTPNTGGGGSGGNNQNVSASGGDGGSGIVIIRIHKDITHKKVVLKYDYDVNNNFAKIPVDSTNLMAHYKFNDSTNLGTDATDNSNDAIVYGEPEYLSNNSISFTQGDGSQYLLFPTNIIKDSGTTREQLTFTFWINKQQSFTGHATYFCIDNNVSSDFSKTIFFGQTGTGSTYIHVRYGNSTVDINTDFDNRATNVWNHYAFVLRKDGNNANIKFYVNGIEYTAYNSNITWIELDDNLKFNRWQTGIYNDNINKHVRDFRIYNKSLSFDEINNLYKENIVSWIKDPNNSSTVAAAKDWKLISYGSSNENWLPGGLLNNISTDKYLAFIYEDTGTYTWVILKKNVIDNNYNWPFNCVELD